MNTTTRTLIAIPLAAAALSAGAAPVMAETMSFLPAQPAGPVVSDLDTAQPDPDPEPEPQPGPQDGPDDKDGPNNDPGPDGPDDLDSPAGDPGPDGPDDLDGPNPGDDDDDSDDSDDDDSDDSDDDDSDDSDDDDSDNDVRRPSRVDAGDGSEGGLSFAWLLGSGAVVSAAGGFTARRVALKRR